MIESHKNYFNTSSKEAINNTKCSGSYSSEHSFIPRGLNIECVHCGKVFKQLEVV